MLTVQFAGSGDAFGSGGRFQACISVRSDQSHVLLDCGASSLIALRRLGIQPSSIDGVIVSHLHGDHFGGIPFLVLDQQFARRDRTLLIAGPPGIRQRVHDAMEIFFPGSTDINRKYELRFVELAERVPTPLLPAVTVTAFRVEHASGAPANGLRLDCHGKVIAYSGDTSWTESLLELAHEADLFICEAYVFDKEVRYHLNYASLMQHRNRLTCRHLILTHASADMLAHLGGIEAEMAQDGQSLSI